MPIQVQLIGESFADFVREHRFAVIHFWATWNGYDRQQRALIESQMQTGLWEEVAFGAVDVDEPENRLICEQHKFKNIPFFAFYRYGALLRFWIGSLTPESLVQFLTDLVDEPLWLHHNTGAVHWVIQENQGDATLVRKLAETIESSGHIAHFVRLEEDLPAPPVPGLADDAPLVCYGPGFTTRASNDPYLMRGLFFNQATFAWSAFQAGWGDAMLSADGRVTSLAIAIEHLKNGGTAFVRPDADSKLFDAAVYEHHGLAESTGGIGLDTKVVVASPLEIETEWRFFIVDRQIVGCSEYRSGGWISTDGTVPNRAIDFAAEAASQWQPAEIYCLDLAQTTERIGVVEANCFNVSRFFGANTAHIIGAINNFVLDKSGRQIPL